MTHILDANIVSAMMRGDPVVAEHLARVTRQAVAIPQPVMAEIAYGIERLPHSRRRDVLEERYRGIESELSRADWTDAVSQVFGRVKAALEKKGQWIEDFDAAIAAHALALGATLVTANVKHMARIEGLRVEDWSR